MLAILQALFGIVLILAVTVMTVVTAALYWFLILQPMTGY